jgi:predicted GNAT family N-acyltransferase
VTVIDSSQELNRFKSQSTPVTLPLKIELTSFAVRASQIKAIRTQVFHQEQQIDPVLDFDGLDEAAIQVVAYVQDQPVGTARVRRLAKAAKIERVAVLLPYRNRGIGRAIVLEILTYLRQRATTEIILNAQCASEPFYRRLGFVPQGAIFQEAGINHIQMRYGQLNSR